MKFKYIFIAVIFVSLHIRAQEIRVEPPNWWTGMNNHQLELMIHGEGISDYKPSVSAKNIKLIRSKRTENKNYLFLNLDISEAKAGNFKIIFAKKGRKNNFSYTYELKERSINSAQRKGFDSSDAIYLITPDRFANGDTSNDIVEGLLESEIDRNDDYARHGGDIKGITKQLDYIDEMGFTAIWSCPMLLNNMQRASYHGYAITDLYKVDPRFGSLQEYIHLGSELKKRGMKLIMDQVENHIGREHWWMKDLPAKDWVNYQKEFEQGEKLVFSNHRRTVNQDTYASEKDKKGMSDGWFVSAMPDLNQRNPFMATYLIQNSIWWIETIGLEGIRQDTYPYSDKKFMSDWAGAIMNEYPHFSIVGEEWSYNPLLVAYWQQGSKNKDGYSSNMSSTMDFPMQRSLVEALNDKESWDNGLVKIYEGLANDFHYADPKNIMVFPDNHDMSRIYTQLSEDLVKTKMAVGFILTLPRIPQIYYGTEILISDSANPGDHGLIRTDFPGGWKGDTSNAFTGKGMSKDQLEMQTFLKEVLNYRKLSKAIHLGKTIHFAPNNGVYMLFRIEDDEVVAVILNKNEQPVNLDLSRFEEIELLGKKMKNIVTGKTFEWGEILELKEQGIQILTTKI